ncbi:cellulase family glycosylhydrolase [Gillisia sp. M10.2A]|uniref:Cellulase family glycosylhydrolase n=1 Tax=Gillisia lutea TaxID=2909668 RepID=A0ABS9EBK3_9FLAO|nr:cellulase family glycosylhydrolase [Gillisia lutea]MCF4100232.1 cellulase family glycosylhydrolase [Gillisia lutea]
MKSLAIYLNFTWLLAVSLISIACTSDDGEVTDNNISVDKTELLYATAGGSESINIKCSANIAWGVKTDADWLLVSKTSGVGTTMLSIEASANNSEEPRTAIVTVFTVDKSLEIEVTQEATAQSISPDASGMSDFTAVELSEIMGVGWNVGNSLDAVGGETAWGNPTINKELIDAVKSAGFNTVRIPVAWSNYIEEGDENFTISNEGLLRVEEVVNYVLENDMFAMVNIHWDGGWMQPTYEEQEDVNDRLNKMWRQIAIHFRDYDYHLIFAGTNEVMVEGDYGTPTEEYYSVQNSFNQTFITTVRQTGGRNSYRYLTVQGFNTNIDHTVNFAEIPEDSVEDRMFMEVHYYDPYEFTLDVSNDNIWQWGEIATDPSATASWGGEEWLATQFQKMYDNFVSQGIGVILGEYGASYRADIPEAEAYREYYYEQTTQEALEHQIVPVIWDNGYPDNHQMGLFDRNDGTEYFPDLIDAITDN